MQPNDCGYRWRSPFPINSNIGRLTMTPEYFTIAVLLAAQAATLAILWDTHRQYSWFRNAWVRDTKELLLWKQNAVMRDPKSGKYVKRIRS
jgi:hypothetical protein